MKQIINGRKYNTETAKECGVASHGYPRDFGYYKETLYCKKNGEYFIFGEGGPASRYAERIDMNSWSGGSKIRPVSYSEAMEWAEENLDADEYEENFGPVSEDDSPTVVTITLSADAAAMVRREMEKTGRTQGAIISELIQAALK